MLPVPLKLEGFPLGVRAQMSGTPFKLYLLPRPASLSFLPALPLVFLLECLWRREKNSQGVSTNCLESKTQRNLDSLF